MVTILRAIFISHNIDARQKWPVVFDTMYCSNKCQRFQAFELKTGSIGLHSRLGNS